MVDAPPSYTEAREQGLTVRGALRAVLNYANDFIARGDIDVLFTVSGGRIITHGELGSNGQSADPAVWGDWLIAWRAVSPGESDGPEERPIDAQHGYRALLVLLERDYKPIDATPMSRVRDDCLAGLNDQDGGATVRDRWETALITGEAADISFAAW